MKHVFKRGLYLIQPQRAYRSPVSLRSRESTSGNAEKRIYDCELTNTLARSSHAWFCVVRPACTRVGFGYS